MGFKSAWEGFTNYLASTKEEVISEWDEFQDEIASLKIQIKHGYMRPYMKYRAEGAVEAEEWKEYWAERPWEDGDNLEFDYDNFIPLFNLTKDINLIKTIFKEFYETGDVSEKHMH